MGGSAAHQGPPVPVLPASVWPWPRVQGQRPCLASGVEARRAGAGGLCCPQGSRKLLGSVREGVRAPPPSTAPGMPPPCFSSLAGGCVLGGSRSPTVPVVISFCNSPPPLYKSWSPGPRGSLSQGHCLAAWAPGSCVSGPAGGRQCCPRPPGARQRGAAEGGGVSPSRRGAGWGPGGQ